eukprot:Protomagalhaensia_wolfi_Nauph_80__3031@NODE_3104_length_888_cov_544_399293_g2433_i0_p1_GENE_NODE_3104_length_888_cov_544_399293_g2433_i0NODE_3104_length_888_cov_544_399293_g2433_i0_p1_ORF_typecomplete_len132_score7_31Lipoprotein_7/PF01540_16/0_0032bZIP_1/PF00170_21/1_2e03bZIP_1/PF00170_21/0_25RE_HpaII/PF09561_10/0_1Synaptobrevin/PF00957_21/5_5e02Synaptobrevin/PF00957_21/0_44_NODE_3104_length_888_cov_544_399293_g2433_i054398
MTTWRGPAMTEELDQRAALFGNRNTRMNPRWEQKQTAVTEVMESINDNKIKDLEAQVDELKDISMRLRDEVHESNSLLGGMVRRVTLIGEMDLLTQDRAVRAGGRHAKDVPPPP